MSCPPHVRCFFDKIKHPEIYDSWYGPWNTVLAENFPTQEGFMVAPQSICGVIFFVVEFVVHPEHIPVFFVEVQPPHHLDHISTRADADAQIRARFRTLYCADVPHLQGISAMGTNFALYGLEEDIVCPLAIPRDGCISKDIAPKERWNWDVLGAGYGVLANLAGSVKERCVMLSS
ncbi:hypothetical protein HGRIS_008349 [Hohenbuehelia grisea]|uniref:Uncharacterized protein n=1 Tax=Hohenbuehelia grisea TaxID=104357 RepID=A0ABR3J956_9AGAR